MPKICKTLYRRFTFTPADTADLGSPFVELIINDGTIVTTFVNSPSAKIFGAELGGRVSLGWLGHPLRPHL